MDELSEKEKISLLAQLALINPEATNNLYDQQMENEDSETDFDESEEIVCIPDWYLAGAGDEQSGLDLIKQGQLCIVLFASDLDTTIDDQE